MLMITTKYWCSTEKVFEIHQYRLHQYLFYWLACFFYKPSSEQCLNSFNLKYFDLSTFSCTQVLWWASYAYCLCFILCWTDEMKESGISYCYIGMLYVLTADWFLECMDSCINPFTTFHFDFLLQLSSDIYISDAKFCCGNTLQLTGMLRKEKSFYVILLTYQLQLLQRRYSATSLFLSLHLGLRKQKGKGKK